MSEVDATVQEVSVTIKSGTPDLTITDNTSQTSVVINADPVKVSVAGDKPTLMVNTGIGGFMDTNKMMQMLTGQLSTDHLDPAIADDINRLRDTWARIGNALLLTAPEGLAIKEASRTYTDEQIASTVADVVISQDGKLDVALSTVKQTADSIDQKVIDLQRDTEGKFTVQNSRILQTEQDITSSVNRLDSNEDSITSLGSQIKQGADRLAMEVVAREAVGDSLNQSKSELTLLKDSLTAAVEVIDSLANRVSSSEMILGPDGVKISTITQGLGNTMYALGTIQNMLKNQWGVSVEEDINGNSYVAGVSLMLHPDWLIDTEYTTDDTMYYDDVAYKCIQSHTATLANNPNGANGATYWKEIPGCEKSAFTISADTFMVSTPGGLQPLFLVDSDSGEVTINGVLSAVIIQSANYPNPDESWFKLDPVTGLAEFNKMVMNFGPGSSGYENLTDRPTSLADINPEEFTNLGAESSLTVFTWAGSEDLNIGADETGADEWVFTSEYSGGNVIQIEVPDDFTGKIGASLNGVQLTTDLHDGGTIVNETTELIDLNQANDDVDLGTIG